MSNVFVIDSAYHPLNPVHPARARQLLTQGKAAVYRRYPFTIVLQQVVEEPEVRPLRLKLDPGSKTTGIALVNDITGQIVFAADLSHRGQAIKASLDRRRALRRGRRQRKTRYRKPRWQNRRRKQGWLPPSLESRLANILTWVRQVCRSAPVSGLSQELVKFDMQLMENPDMIGMQYQQGTLQGYEVREYLLEKWQRACAYCGKNVGIYSGRVAVRTTGSFNITTEQGTVQGISHRFCQTVHRSDGYSYWHWTSTPLPQ